MAKFGRVVKIVINRTPYGNPHNPSYGAYITYVNKEAALACVRAIDNSVFDDRVMRASLGTTKYCSNFLRNQPCTNKDCLYLHEKGDEAVSYTKEDMLAGRHTQDVQVAAPAAASSGNGRR